MIRQTECRKRDCKNRGSTQVRERVHDRQRIRRDMDFRQHALAGHAERLRQCKTGTEGLPAGTR